MVLICHDDKVPSVRDDVNQEGKSVPKSMPRIRLDHWVLVDIDPFRAGIEEGEYASGVTPKGKPGPESIHGTRHGLNDYTKWFDGDPDMGGQYFGYDGPAPPWNDELIHDYHFTLYALDVPKVAVSGAFTADDVLLAIKGHVLAEARMTGRYAINPAAQ